jgi:hypothetical protein
MASASRTTRTCGAQVGTPGIGAVGNGSASIRVGFPRRGGMAASRMVDVVGEAHGDAAIGRFGEGALDDRCQRVRQPDVVHRDLERAAGRRDPVGELMSDLLRRLTAVGERPEY